MQKETKFKIRFGLFTGIFFALGMAGFDYSDGYGFRVWRFIINALFFGILMGFTNKISLKKTAKNENKNDVD